MIIKPEEQYRQLSEQSIALMQTQIAEDRALVTDDTIKELERSLNVRGSLHDRFVMGTFYVKSRHSGLIRKGIEMMTDLLRYGGTEDITKQQTHHQPPHDNNDDDDEFAASDPNRTVLLGQSDRAAASSPSSSSSSTTTQPFVSKQSKQQSVQPVPSSDPFHKNRIQYKRDCLYFIALGHYHLEEYPEAKRRLENLLRIDPRNEQAQRFMMLVDQQIKDQGKRGLAIAAGATVGAGVAVGALAVGAAVLFALVRR